MKTLIISVTFNENTFDLAVKEEQRISEVFNVLTNNGLLFYSGDMETMLLRSWRLGTLVNPRLTFKQANIENGDILRICPKNKIETHT